MISLTSVTPAPSSPASPIPAMNRKAAYCATDVTAGVQQVRRRVDEDRPEEHRETAALVAEHAPGDASEEHPQHLHIQQQDPGLQQARVRHTNRRQASHPDDRKENQVVDVDEVAERSNDHRQRDGSAIERGSGGAKVSHAPGILRRELAPRFALPPRAA